MQNISQQASNMLRSVAVMIKRSLSIGIVVDRCDAENRMTETGRLEVNSQIYISIRGFFGLADRYNLRMHASSSAVAAAAVTTHRYAFRVQQRTCRCDLHASALHTRYLKDAAWRRDNSPHAVTSQAAAAAAGAVRTADVDWMTSPQWCHRIGVIAGTHHVAW